eukprot:359322-Chlamydomonas_euryale.AAC.2
MSGRIWRAWDGGGEPGARCAAAAPVSAPAVPGADRSSEDAMTAAGDDPVAVSTSLPDADGRGVLMRTSATGPLPPTASTTWDGDGRCATPCCSTAEADSPGAGLSTAAAAPLLLADALHRSSIEDRVVFVPRVPDSTSDSGPDCASTGVNTVFWRGGGGEQRACKPGIAAMHVAARGKAHGPCAEAPVSRYSFCH